MQVEAALRRACIQPRVCLLCRFIAAPVQANGMALRKQLHGVLGLCTGLCQIADVLGLWPWFQQRS